MRFTNFKEFRGVLQVADYLATDLANFLRDLRFGLDRLSFDENFEGFIVEDIEIGVGAELKIRNQLRNIVPSQRLILRGKAGTENIVDGDTEWTTNFVYLKNNGATAITTATKVKVLFLK